MRGGTRKQTRSTGPGSSPRASPPPDHRRRTRPGPTETTSRPISCSGPTSRERSRKKLAVVIEFDPGHRLPGPDYDEALRIHREVTLPVYGAGWETPDHQPSPQAAPDTRTIARTAGGLRRGAADAAAEVELPVYGAARGHPVGPPSPGARSRTWPASAATTTRQLSCSAKG